MNAHTIRCGLSLFVIVGVVVIPWTQQESTTLSFCGMATKKNNIMENFMDSVIDCLADSNNEEEAKEKFAGMLAAKRNPEFALKMIMEKIQTSFEEDLNKIIKDNYNNSIMLDLLCKSSIASNIEAFKSSSTMHIMSGLSKSQYDLFVDKIAKEIMNKYFE